MSSPAGVVWLPRLAGRFSHWCHARRHSSWGILSRYDETGLIWLQERPVVALTETTGAIQNPTDPTGVVTTYRRPKVRLGIVAG